MTAGSVRRGALSLVARRVANPRIGSGVPARADAARRRPGASRGGRAGSGGHGCGESTAVRSPVHASLLADEFDFVHRSHPSYIAHEFLAVNNHAYWRSDFMQLTRAHGFEYVADADFNYSSGRLPETLEPWLKGEGITGRSLEDTVDSCAIGSCTRHFTPTPFVRAVPSVRDFGSLWMASRLIRRGSRGHPAIFRHPSGYEVEAKEREVDEALERLAIIWPRGLRVASLFPDVAHVMDDLRLLHRTQLIDLRLVEPGDSVGCDNLRRLESKKGGYYTTPYHTREAAVAVTVQ